VNGNRHGITTLWYENGQVMTQGESIDGRKEGTQAYYNKDGTIKFRWCFKNGEKIKDEKC